MHLRHSHEKGRVHAELLLRIPKSWFSESYDSDVAKTVMQFEIDGGKRGQNTSQTMSGHKNALSAVLFPNLIDSNKNLHRYTVVVVQKPLMYITVQALGKRAVCMRKLQVEKPIRESLTPSKRNNGCIMIRIISNENLYVVGHLHGPKGDKSTGRIATSRAIPGQNIRNLAVSAFRVLPSKQCI